MVFPEIDGEERRIWYRAYWVELLEIGMMVFLASVMFGAGFLTGVLW